MKVHNWLRRVVLVVFYPAKMLNIFRAVPTSSAPTCMGMLRAVLSTADIMSVTASCLPSVCSACVSASACGTNSGLISIPWLMAEFPSDHYGSFRQNLSKNTKKCYFCKDFTFFGTNGLNMHQRTHEN